MVCFQCFLEETAGSLGITLCSKHKIQRVAFFIYSSIKVGSFPLDLDIGLINTPRLASPFQMWSDLFVDLRSVLMHPSHNGGMRQIKTSFLHHFNQISVAQAVTAIPSYIQKDDLAFVMLPAKWIFGRVKRLLSRFHV